jgi:hypothetical protein
MSKFVERNRALPEWAKWIISVTLLVSWGAALVWAFGRM